MIYRDDKDLEVTITKLQSRVEELEKENLSLKKEAEENGNWVSSYSDTISKLEFVNEQDRKNKDFEVKISFEKNYFCLHSEKLVASKVPPGTKIVWKMFVAKE